MPGADVVEAGQLAARPGLEARPDARPTLVAGSTRGHLPCYQSMYDPPVSDFSGYRFHLIMAPWRLRCWFGLARHLPSGSSGAMGPQLAKYAKPKKLPRLPVRTMSQTVSRCA